MKVLLAGAYGSANFGDDALMLTAADILRTLDVDYCIRASRQRYVEDWVGSQRINDTGDTAGYSIVVYGGGTQFFSFNRAPFRSGTAHKAAKLLSLITHPKRIRGAILRRAVFRARGPATAGPDSALLGVGLGPFEDESALLQHALLFRAAGFVSVRDALSEAYLEEAGVTRFHRCGDLCFTKNFKELAGLRRHGSAGRQCSTRPKVIIVLRDWHYTEQGVVPRSALQQILNSYEKAGIHAELMFFSREHDKGWIRQAKKIGAPYTVWNPDNTSIAGFMRKLASADLIVSARYHGLVMATLTGVPFIGVNIEPKVESFCSKAEYDNLWGFPYLASDLLDKSRQIIFGEGRRERIEENLLALAQAEEMRNDVMLEEFSAFIKGKRGSK